MSETAWYPKGYNGKPNRTHSQCTKCSRSCPYSCIQCAHVHKASRDCHSPFQVDSSQRGKILCPRSRRQFNSTIAIGTDSAPGMGTVCTLRLIKFAQQFREAEINILTVQRWKPRLTEVKRFGPSHAGGQQKSWTCTAGHLTARAVSAESGIWQKWHCRLSAAPQPPRVTSQPWVPRAEARARK